MATSLLAFTAFSQPAWSKVLITVAEAERPDDTLARRDAFPGPKILLDLPATSENYASSPLHLRLRFETRGAKIDLNSLYVTYRKLPPADLTDRVREFTTSSGIDMPVAELPPGVHKISVEVKDVDGLSGHLDFILHVPK